MIFRFFLCSGLWDIVITLSEESYLVFVCVCVCVLCVCVCVCVCVCTI